MGSKHLFWEKASLNRKISKFRHEAIHVDNDSLYSCQGSWKSVKRNWPNRPVRGIHDEKNNRKRLVCGPFLWRSWSDLVENFTESLFPHSTSLCQLCPNPSTFPRDIRENDFYTMIAISADFSLTIIAGFSEYCIHKIFTRSRSAWSLQSIRLSYTVHTAAPRARDNNAGLPRSQQLCVKCRDIAKRAFTSVICGIVRK